MLNGQQGRAARPHQGCPRRGRIMKKRWQLLGAARKLPGAAKNLPGSYTEAAHQRERKELRVAELGEGAPGAEGPNKEPPAPTTPGMCSIGPLAGGWPELGSIVPSISPSRSRDSSSAPASKCSCWCPAGGSRPAAAAEPNTAAARSLFSSPPELPAAPDMSQIGRAHV